MNDKRTITLIAIILAGVVSLLFLVVTPVTTHFLIAYSLALFGIGGLWACTFLVINRERSYPWVAALSVAALTYLIIELVVSTAVVLPAQLGIWTLPIAWFVLIHATVLSFFAIRIIMLLGGAHHIEARGDVVQHKVLALRSLQSDVEIAAAQAGDETLKKTLMKLAEKIQFSDPMSHASLATLEMKIEEKIADLKRIVLKNESERALAAIQDIELSLDERNRKTRLLK